MTKITKEQVLENLEDVKKYINEAESEAEGIAIKNRWTGDIISQSTKTTLEEAVSEAVENCANLHYADLCDANLYGADLRDANLREANLRGADLRGAKLRYANLGEANLRDANLRDANLRYANLRDANLRYATLDGANLFFANLYKANLSGVSLYKADLCKANISETNLQNVKFYGKSGTTRIGKSQVEDLLEALGISVNE